MLWETLEWTSSIVSLLYALVAHVFARSLLVRMSYLHKHTVKTAPLTNIVIAMTAHPILGTNSFVRNASL